MKKRLIVLIPLLLGAAVSASAKKNVRWLDEPYYGYDEQQYICATGNGSSYEEADKKAISAVSAILMQSISAEEVVNQSATSKGEDLSTYLANIRTNSTVKDISGLSIKDRTKTKNKTYYARAVLNKEAAAKQYVIALQKNSVKIDALLEDSKTYSKSFDECKALIQAYTIASENDYLLSMLSVLRPQAHYSLTYGSSAEISSKIKAAFHAITVRIVTTGANADRIAPSTASAINNFGFATTNAQNAAYTFLVDFSVEELEKPSDSDIFYTRYILTCALKETQTEKEVLNYTANKRVGKLTKKDSVQSAVRTAQNVLQEEFAQKFKALFD